MNDKEQLQRLNEYQKAAVFDESNACLVNANVGSGKTTVLITKVMYLHCEKQIPYRQMVVLTFTNKAADEIKERLLALEPDIPEEELWGFGTFHSVCLRMLKEQLPVEQLGYTKDFMVMDPEEEAELAEQLIVTYQLKIKYKNRLKKRLEQQKSKYKDDIETLKVLLQEAKKRQDKMTFDELLTNTCKLLKDYRESQDKIEGGTLSWIIVDEVQDSDEKQLALIDCLKSPKTHFFAVGDPNQVIYSWRGSAFHIFYQLKTKYQATELTLPVNYRSSKEILAVARCFMQQGGVLEGSRAESRDGEKIQIRKMYDPFQEADYLAGRIQKLHEVGVPYREIAIFYRLQEQSAVFEQVFAREGIPFEVSLKKTVKDLPVLNWLLKVLHFAVNPRDLASGIAALTDKKYGDGMTVREAEEKIAFLVGDSAEAESGNLNRICETEKEHSDGLGDTNEELDVQKLEKHGKAKGNKVKSRSSELAEVMAGFEKIYRNRDSITAEELLDYFSLDSHLHPITADYRENRALVCDFLQRMIAYQEEKKEKVLDGFREFLNLSSLYGMHILQKEIHNEDDSVKLMTLHASKGLEFSYVFITGVNYGLIPLQTKSFEEEEEEQRLFFVGITRAKEHLELSYYTNPGQYRAMSGPSRFLRMIPGRLVEGGELEKTDAAAHLQELKREILKNRQTEEDKRSSDSHAEKKKQQDPVLKTKRTDQRPPKKVKHSKYGYGVIISEDDIMIKVVFEDYGEKDLMKAFTALEYPDS